MAPRGGSLAVVDLHRPWSPTKRPGKPPPNAKPTDQPWFWGNSTRCSNLASTRPPRNRVGAAIKRGSKLPGQLSTGSAADRILAVDADPDAAGHGQTARLSSIDDPGGTAADGAGSLEA